MAKISALDPVADLDGGEQVVLVKGGRSRRASIGGLVSATVGPHVAEAQRAEQSAALAATSAITAAGGTLYPDVEAGLAATEEGNYFAVAGNGGDSYAILYRKMGGEAVEQARYASQAAYEALDGADRIGQSRGAVATLPATVRQALSSQPINVFEAEMREAITEKPDLNDPGSWTWDPAFAKAQALTTHVVVPALPGGSTYRLGAIATTSVNQHLDFAHGAIVNFLGTPAGIACIDLAHDFSRVTGGTFNASQADSPLILLRGFRNYVDHVKTTGTCGDVIDVQGLEASITLTRVRGGTRAGINVGATDLFLDNVYAEYCRDGIYSNGVGSITGHHLHAYHNSRHGAYLIGADKSELTAWCADTNGQNGFNIVGVSSGLTLRGCLALKNSDQEANHSDYWFDNVQHARLDACISTGTSKNFAKAYSFKVNPNCRDIKAFACQAEIDGYGWAGVVAAMGCQGALTKYNRAQGVVETDAPQIAAGAVGTLTTAIGLDAAITLPGMLCFELLLKRRGWATPETAMERFDATCGLGTAQGSVTPLTLNPGLSIEDMAIEQIAPGAHILTLRVKNNLDHDIQACAQVRFAGTGRGYV